MRVSLFITCFNDTLFPQTGRAVVTVLERVGVQVDFPAGQTCCGQIHANTGYGPEALPLIRHFIHTFADSEAIVTPSASCASMVIDQYHRIAEQAGDQRLVEEVDDIVPRVHEFTSFLADTLKIEDLGAHFPHRVTYHPSCHGLRMLKIGDAPERLLRAVHGIDLVELPDALTCCGFGGTFAVKNAAVSTAMLADKMAAITQTGAEICAAADNSCLMHIGGGLNRLRSGITTMHIAEILATEES